MNKDVYFKKEITHKDSDHVMRFRVAQDLFSSHQIDAGTRLLLRTIAGIDSQRYHRILDLGCGYGPIGLTLKGMDHSRVIDMVDRDALAVEYTRQNAELNHLSDINIYGSLGYDDVPATDFDLITSNIPGKSGESVITYLIQEAAYYLNKGGTVAVVVVAALEPMVTRIIGNTPGADILLRRVRSGHTVFHYNFINQTIDKTKPTQSGLDRGLYHRDKVTMSHQGINYHLQTAYGLPEFDSLDYRSQLLIEGMNSIKNSNAKSALVFNTGQGHIPVALWKLFSPGNISLVDRDLLSLRYSRMNLINNGCPDESINSSHQVGIGIDNQPPADIIVGTIREGEGSDAIALVINHITKQLAISGTALLSASSTAITRIVKLLRSQDLLRLRKRERRHGYSSLTLERNRS